jgi:hypothetical protein
MEYTHNFSWHESSNAGMLTRRLYEFFDIEKCQVFVETGTFQGDTVQWATEKGHYKKFYSVELLGDRFEYCRSRFSNDSRIEILQGDTVTVLEPILKKISDPTLIYLDAHPIGYDFPIIEESNIIFNNFYDLDNVVVCIDDERLFSEELKQSTKSIYAQHGFVDCYVDDSMVFCRKHWLK